VALLAFPWQNVCAEGYEGGSPVGPTLPAATGLRHDRQCLGAGGLTPSPRTVGLWLPTPAAYRETLGWPSREQHRRRRARSPFRADGHPGRSHTRARRVAACVAGRRARASRCVPDAVWRATSWDGLMNRPHARVVLGMGHSGAAGAATRRSTSSGPRVRSVA
jgi:hypothetical protein